jgi:hypothetical protein
MNPRGDTGIGKGKAGFAEILGGLGDRERPHIDAIDGNVLRPVQVRWRFSFAGARGHEDIDASRERLRHGEVGQVPLVGLLNRVDDDDQRLRCPALLAEQIVELVFRAIRPRHPLAVPVVGPDLADQIIDPASPLGKRQPALAEEMVGTIDVGPPAAADPVREQGSFPDPRLPGDNTDSGRLNGQPSVQLVQQPLPADKTRRLLGKQFFGTFSRPQAARRPGSIVLKGR